MRFPGLLIFLILLMTPFCAQALEENLPPQLVKIRLVPERGQIRPGEEMWIGIEQSIEPGWHTYWKNPGDSGVPPRVMWELPDGFTASEISWPAPQRLPYGPLLNYGYSDQVVLLQKIKAPEPLPPGALTLRATIDVLVCKEECIPETGTYEITLNDGEADNTSYIETVQSMVPEQAKWDAEYSEKDGFFTLHLPEDALSNFEQIEFFPVEWGLVENTAEAEKRAEGGRISIAQKRANRALAEVGDFEGVIVFKENGERRAYSFNAKPRIQKAGAVKNISEAPPVGILQALLLALFGGLVLNLMPCVFPVLSIKALSLVEAVNKDRTRVRMHGLSYTSGVVLSFLALAATLIALKAGGTQIGWGFQLQNPLVIGALVYLFIVIGMSLFGLFELGGRFANAGSHFTRGEGYRHSFFTGVLATLVATPCTAPFMGVAIGYALVQPAFVALPVFAALGFGLALPYLLLSFVPALQKILPRPGHWMETFRQALAFPMLASAAWLTWVLAQQAGEMAVLKILMGGLLLVLALWAARQITLTRIWRVIKYSVVIVAVIAALMLLPFKYAAGEKFGEPFSTQALESYLQGDDPVFVEMTAAWCITCKFNHATSINIDSTREAFAKHNVRYLIGDWTNADPVITEYLKRYGRSGVPLYVYYAPKEGGQRPEAQVLPQVLTPDFVASLIDPTLPKEKTP